MAVDDAVAIARQIAALETAHERLSVEKVAHTANGRGATGLGRVLEHLYPRSISDEIDVSNEQGPPDAGGPQRLLKSERFFSVDVSRTADPDRTALSAALRETGCVETNRRFMLRAGWRHPASMEPRRPIRVHG